MVDEHPLIGELVTLTGGMKEARTILLGLQDSRDQVIYRLAKAGVARKRLAELAELAEVSIYKILEKVKGRDSSAS